MVFHDVTANGVSQIISDFHETKVVFCHEVFILVNNMYY